jgi:hypothetical protein
MKIRAILLILCFFFFSFQVKACDCVFSNYSQSYSHSELVLKAKIVKIYKNSSPNNPFFKVDILPIEIFKGNPTESILVEGSSDNRMRSSCDLFTQINSIWIIYANRNSDGKFVFGMCSSSRNINPYFSRPVTNDHFKTSVNLELNVLKFLREENINETNEYSLYSNELSDFLKEFNGIPFDNSFAFYEINLDSELKVISVKAVKPFSNQSVSAKIMNFLKTEVIWSQSPYVERSEVGLRLLKGFYYYPAEEEEESFISLLSL